MHEDEAAQYRVYASLRVHERRVAWAMTAVRDALATHPGLWAVGASGGKDSTALVALCVAAGWRGPLFHFFYAETPPENTALVHLLAQRYGLDLHTLRVPGAWDVFAAAGRFFVHPDTDAERALVRAMLTGYKRAANDHAVARGYVGQFWGLRAEESRPRAITLARKGACYQTQDRATWTCCPLRYWTARDVWGYLVTHDLPHLRRYDRLPDRERARSEETWLAAEGLWRYGQGRSLRTHDPERWRELVARFPELANWG